MSPDYCLDLRQQDGATFWLRCGQCNGCREWQAREHAAAEAAGAEPRLAPPSAADYRREATADDADAQGGGTFE